MATIEEVASVARVSKATVSRVINRRGNVHPETVRAVREAISRTQYQAGPPRPDRGIEPSRLAVYGLIVPGFDDGGVSLLGGFQAAAKKNDHQIIACNTGNQIAKQGHAILELIHKKVDGVALLPVASARTPRAHIDLLGERGIPVVLLHRDVEAANAPLIALPLEEAGYQAGRALFERGHRRIGFFGCGEGEDGDRHRHGLRRALSEAGSDLPAERICLCTGVSPLSIPTLTDSVEAGLRRMWELPGDRRPTGLYVASDTIAEVVYLGLLKSGVRVPQDVSIMSFGRAQRNTAIASQLSSVVIDDIAIGRAAVECLKQGHPFGAAREGARRVCNAGLSLAPGATLGEAYPLSIH